MSRTSRNGRLLLAATLAALLAPAAVHALPLLSRAGDAPCARCHTSAPALSAEGLRAHVTAEHLAPLAAHAAGPAMPPFSVVSEFGATFARTDTLAAAGARGARNTSEFRLHTLDLYAAGALSPAITYGAQASAEPESSTVRVPQLYARFGSASGGAFAATVGRFETGLPWLSDRRRGTLAPLLTPAAIAAEGAEVLAHRNGWTAAAGIVNSDRTPDAGARSFNRLENSYVWVMRASGAQLLGGRVLFARQPSDISYHAWLQRLQVTLGASLGTDRLRIEPAYVLDRFDDRPAAGIHQRHQYAVLQGVARLDADGATALVFRFEHEHVTPTVLTRGEDHDLEVARLAHWATPNVRLAFEASHAGDNRGGPRTTHVDATVTLAY